MALAQFPPSQKGNPTTNSLQHPLPPGQIVPSPGGHFNYRIIGPCCRLFDREELPWPCCRLQWRGKEPSWRRIGRRFINDLASRNRPSYSVEIIGQDYAKDPLILTFYAETLPTPTREWWYTKHPHLANTASDVPKSIMGSEPLHPETSERGT